MMLPVDCMMRVSRRLFPFSPLLEFLTNLLTTATGPINGSKSKLVLLSYFVFGQDILEVPGGVGRLSLFVDAAAGRRVREADFLSPIKHQHEKMIAKQAVIKWLIIAQGREIFVKGVAETRAKLQL